MDNLEKAFPDVRGRMARIIDPRVFQERDFCDAHEAARIGMQQVVAYEKADAILAMQRPLLEGLKKPVQENVSSISMDRARGRNDAIADAMRALGMEK